VGLFAGALGSGTVSACSPVVAGFTHPNAEDANVDERHVYSGGNHELLSFLSILKNDTDAVDDDLKEELGLYRPEKHCNMLEKQFCLYWASIPTKRHVKVEARSDYPEDV